MWVIVYWCIGIVALIMLCGILLSKEDRGHPLSYILLLPLTSGMIGGLIGIVIIVFGRDSSRADTYEKQYQTIPLITLDTRDNIEGSFFLGSGYISGSLYYHYYYMTKDGAKYERVRAEEAFIKEYDGTPKIVKYGMFERDSTSIFYKEGLTDETKSILYIPKGTIKTDFKVN